MKNLKKNKSSMRPTWSNTSISSPQSSKLSPIWIIIGNFWMKAVCFAKLKLKKKLILRSNQNALSWWSLDSECDLGERWKRALSPQKAHRLAGLAFWIKIFKRRFLILRRKTDSRQIWDNFKTNFKTFFSSYLTLDLRLATLCASWIALYRERRNKKSK